MKRFCRPADPGFALVLVLMAIAASLALGTALVLSTVSESAMAANFNRRSQALYAAEAIGELTLSELGSIADWSTVVSGEQASQFGGGEPSVQRLSDGTTVDLAAIVNLANCDAPAPCGGTPTWRLFAHGPLESLSTLGTPAPAFYLVALVAALDAAASGVKIRGEAFGVAGAHRAVEIEAVREAAGARVRSWRAP
jgi:hypothetical protein